MNWFVYILRCADGSYYTGVSTDVDRRLKQHNGLLPGGSKYVRSHRPAVVVFRMKCSSKSEALRREARYKKISHDKKARLDYTNYDRKGRYTGPLQKVVRP